MGMRGATILVAAAAVLTGCGESSNGNLTSSSSSGAGTPGTYALTDLGALAGGNTSANAINVAGMITGDSSNIGDTADYAFLFSGDAMINLGSLGGTLSG